MLEAHGGKSVLAGRRSFLEAETGHFRRSEFFSIAAIQWEPPTFPG